MQFIPRSVRELELTRLLTVPGMDPQKQTILEHWAGNRCSPLYNQYTSGFALTSVVFCKNQPENVDSLAIEAAFDALIRMQLVRNFELKNIPYIKTVSTCRGENLPVLLEKQSHEFLYVVSLTSAASSGDIAVAVILCAIRCAFAELSGCGNVGSISMLTVLSTIDMPRYIAASDTLNRFNDQDTADICRMYHTAMNLGWVKIDELISLSTKAIRAIAASMTIGRKIVSVPDASGKSHSSCESLRDLTENHNEIMQRINILSMHVW